MGASVKDRIFVPLFERDQNEVDRLKERIRQIQKNCVHDFRLIKEPELKESLVSGVFVGMTASSTEVGQSESFFTLVCMKCSMKKICSIVDTCPKCLNSMKLTGQRSEHAGGRKKYFGIDFLYYSVQLRSCTNCHFAIASDEWDQ